MIKLVYDSYKDAYLTTTPGNYTGDWVTLGEYQKLLKSIEDLTYLKDRIIDIASQITFNARYKKYLDKETLSKENMDPNKIITFLIQELVDYYTNMAVNKTLNSPKKEKKLAIKTEAMISKYLEGGPFNNDYIFTSQE